MIGQDVMPVARQHCGACGEATEPYSLAQAQQQLAAVAGWRLSDDGKRIRKDWELKSFMAAMDFFNRVAQVAEAEAHHPDLHLEGYRHAWIELWTHAVGGLSDNDFILAAKIDLLPVELR
jgi:4a-hydroxytetrahydrobiopterin dehydratase